MDSSPQDQPATHDKSIARDSLPDWRTVCQREAFAAADAEDRESWGVSAGETVPFRYRWEHVQDVVRHALWLAKETGADAEVVEAAAWLHDVRKRQPSHGDAGAEAAAKILEATDYPQAKRAAVIDAIRKHVGLTRSEPERPLQPLEAAVLWDADKLSKIGVQALASQLSTIYVIGKPLAKRRMESLEFTRDVLRESVDSMNTKPARRLAEKRYHEMMQTFAWWEMDENLV